MVGSLGLGVECAHGGEGSPNVSATNTTFQMHSNEPINQLKVEQDRGAALDAALAYAAKQREDRIRGIPPPPSQYPFPNYDAGPLRPPPAYLNFYRIDAHYTNYLLCQYDVDVKNYVQSDEPKWFKAALKQIRNSGPEKFPPIKWIAVIIVNRGEYKDISTFEQCYKVGALFKAGDVFDSGRDLSQLVADAKLDRHPFLFNQQRSELFPANQQRWMIVERHAATNHIDAAPNSSK